MDYTISYTELLRAVWEAPAYHLAFEGFLVMWLLWLIFHKSYKPEPTELTEKEKEELIQEWKPEPLVPKIDEEKFHYALNPRIVTSKLGKTVVVDGKTCINFATHNYLGLSEDELLEEAALKGLKKYGVGSCGPRGFYGTVDVHLELEDRIAKFMNCEESALYSYGFSAVASAIPAYAKAGDIIFADEGVHFAIQKGLQASRSKIKWFKHNDYKDLQRLMEEQEREDLRNPKKAKVIRKFLVVEGLYVNWGDVCPLPELVELKKRFKVRMFVDETVSFGLLGETGHGVTEHFGISVDELDMITGTLEYGMSSYGGFAVGSSFIVDHQRLSGLGYCFSASLPPLQASVALAAFDKIQNEPQIISRCKELSQYAHKQIKSKLAHFKVSGVSYSPVKHLRLVQSNLERQQQTKILEAICDEGLDAGIALTVARYIEHEEHLLPQPSIRFIISSKLTEEDIDKAIDFIKESSNKRLG